MYPVARRLSIRDSSTSMPSSAAPFMDRCERLRASHAAEARR
jgi:hypothetical protein